jgi:hypothetical protein
VFLEEAKAFFFWRNTHPMYWLRQRSHSQLSACLTIAWKVKDFLLVCTIPILKANIAILRAMSIRFQCGSTRHCLNQQSWVYHNAG